MTLDPRITRCHGQHYSGAECPRAAMCERHIQRSTREAETPVSWSVCPESSGAYPFQIRPADSAPKPATLTPSQQVEMEDACAAHQMLELKVRGEVA
jgi:hypothetical protein